MGTIWPSSTGKISGKATAPTCMCPSANCSRAMRRVKSSIKLFFADGVAVHDAALLPLERFALEDLRNAPAQEFDAGLHVLLEAVGLAARQRQQRGRSGFLKLLT